MAERVPLDAVVPFSPNQAWVFGTQHIGAYATARTAPIWQRWDGSQWSVAHPPGRFYVSAGAATPDRHVFVVGSEGPHILSGRLAVAEWAGSKWTTRFFAASDPRYHRLFAVDATSARDAWAVGYDGYRARPMVMHWNGSAWTRSVFAKRRGKLFAVVAMAPRDVWIGGVSVGRPVAAHWDGRRWKWFSIRSSFAGYNAVNALTASGRDVWAGGYGFLVRWKGTAWGHDQFRAAMRAIGSRSVSDEIRGLAATSAKSVWALTAENIVHWDSIGWKPSGSHRIAVAAQDLAASTGTAVWAVGGYGDRAMVSTYSC